NAMNKGIRLSHGEWLNFMNGGDAFTDAFVLSRIFSGKNHPEADILYGKNHFIDPKTQRISGTADYPKKLSMEFFSYACLCHQSTFIRRKLFEEFGGYNEEMKMCADYEKLILWFHARKRFQKLPMVIANFRRGGISTTDPQLQTCERALAREVLPIEQRRILATAREPLETSYKCKLFDLVELFKIKRTRSGKIKTSTFSAFPCSAWNPILTDGHSPMTPFPKLTVITVCRNEPNIERTCRSIVSQTWQDFEWIVVDGASTDGTLEILEKYKDRIDVFVSEPDSGIYNAMNKGIRLAHGEFLNFMNGGDEFASARTLETVFREPENSYDKYGIIFGDAITENNGVKRLVSFPRKRALSRLVADGFSINHQSAFIRRDLFQKFGLYDESYRIAADYKMWLVCALKKIRFLNLEFPVCIFNLDGISQQNRTAATAEKQAAVNDVFRRKELKKIQKINSITLFRGLCFNTLEIFRCEEDSSHKKRNFYVFGIPLLSSTIRQEFQTRPQISTNILARELQAVTAKESQIHGDLAARVGKMEALTF
ncbi:MAG: glycosyltransferase, partial [Clostridia bacterium]